MVHWGLRSMSVQREEFWEELAGLFGLCFPKWCVGGGTSMLLDL